MRFNTKRSDVVTNFEGDKAYKLDDKMQLYALCCTSVLHSKFYTTNDHERVCKLVRKVDPEFVKKLAIYVRTKMYLRTIPIVLLGNLAALRKLDAETVYQVINRPDEILELLSYYQMMNDRDETLKPLSKAIQNGIKLIFERGKFDAYQYAKYNRDTAIKFRDAIFLCHPKPQNEEQDKLFKDIINDTLETPYTWEVELSTKGNTKEVWEELIDSKRLPYMATLRNLRNILNADVDVQHIKQIVNYISDPNQVKKSKQLPFRYLSAYYAIKESNSFYNDMLVEALNKAITASVHNIPLFDNEKVLIACDVSGSMSHLISPNSSIQYYQIGLLLGMLLQHKCKLVKTGLFGDIFKLQNLPKDNVLNNVEQFENLMNEVGISTNGWRVIQYLIDRKMKVDRIMIFTDCQLWDNTYNDEHIVKKWHQYKKMNPNAKLYIFDLAGYGETPISIREGNVHLIAGWSDKVFDALHALENGKNILSVIENS